MQQNANSNLGPLPISQSLSFDGFRLRLQINPGYFVIANKLDHKALSDVYVELRTP